MRTILKILGWSGLIGITSAIVFLLWLRGLWIDVYSQEQLEEVVVEAQMALELPENFKTTLLKIHPTILINGMFAHMFRMISTDKDHTPCPCRQLGHMIMPDHDRMSRGARVFYTPSFIWAIERQVDQTQCLSLLLQHLDFTHGIRGIDNASQEYFGDSLANLSEEQHIELIMKFKNPVLYNKNRGPDFYQAELQRLKEKRG